VTSRTIYGANSHPAVLSVAGVDTRKQRVGYSSTGPGRLWNEKPDLCCYTHFSGSGVYAADGGTSAAAPAAAGVIAALRSRFRYDPSRPTTSPAALRQSLIRSADAQGATGHSAELGWGILDGCRLALEPPA
jgi:subtilisin family serine protease